MKYTTSLSLSIDHEGKKVAEPREEGREKGEMNRAEGDGTVEGKGKMRKMETFVISNERMKTRLVNRRARGGKIHRLSTMAPEKVESVHRTAPTRMMKVVGVPAFLPLLRSACCPALATKNSSSSLIGSHRVTSGSP